MGYVAMDKQLVKISKLLSFILRHHPERLGLKLDAYGRVDLNTLIQRFNAHYQVHLDRQVLAAIMRQSDKRRFALEGNKIRAVYGHSVPVLPLMPASKPPTWLYHGTSHQAAIMIESEGLRPMNRDFVHLSSDLDMAKQVGSRHDAHPVIFRIDALAAFTAGALFYPTGSRVWLTGKILPKFLTRMPTSG